MTKDAQIETAFEDPIHLLVRHAISVKYTDLPPETVEFQKRRLLDNIGCMLAGAREEGVRQARKMWQGYGSNTQASLMFFSDKLPLSGAVYTNAIMARALDFCDTLPPGYHPSSTDVPIALAVAEVTAKPGSEIITALAVAQDIAQRINNAGAKPGELYGGFDSNVLGLFSGTIVAALLFELNAEQMSHAIGLAFNHGIGTFQANKDKTLAVRYIQAFVARACVESVLLAKEGVTGLRNTLCGELGFFAKYAGRTPTLNALTDDLGDIFHGENQTIFKLYPSCGLTLALTDAALALRDHIKDPGRDIEHVSLEISSSMALICGDTFDAANATPVDAMFSVEYVVANAFLRGRSTLAEFTQDAVQSSDTTAFIDRVSKQTNSEFVYDQCVVTVKLRNGKIHKEENRFGRGWPQKPATQKDLEAKFRNCLKHNGISEDRADRIMRLVSDLGEAKSVFNIVDACHAIEPAEANT